MTSLHITLLYAGLLGLFLVILSFNMVKAWIDSKCEKSAAGEDGRGNNDLRRAEALVRSFTDYVPLILLLMGFVEIGGAPPLALHMMGTGLFAARLMHAFGSNYSKAADGMRFLGAQLTYLILTLASFGCLYLYASAGKF